MKSLINRKHAQVDFNRRAAGLDLYLTGLYDETVALEKENEISSIGGSFTDNANQLHGQTHRRERRELRRAHGAAGTLEAIVRRRVAKTAGSAQKRHRRCRKGYTLRKERQLQENKGRTAWLAGATGLVGGFVLKQLSPRSGTQG